MSTQIVSGVVSSAEKGQIVRKSANYHPSIWGDYFISYSTPDDQTIKTWCEEANILKEKVREMLTNNFTEKPLKERLDLVDVIQRLGIAYHFEDEIKEAVKQIFNQDFDDNHLHTSALRFRLLREFGYNVSCDVFNKFKDGSFKEAITRDISGLLSLYEAAHLTVHEEVILDEALSFTTSNLESVVSNLNPSIAKQIVRALRHPLRKGLTRLEAREYLSFYQENKSHNEVLLKFAKLDFNILQKQHQKELSTISKWWKNLEFKRKLPFARDRVVECYFWATGVFYEPQYALGRKFFTKLIAILSTIDDIYDIHGTNEELVLFTEAVERWDISAMDKLPEYMKACYEALLDVFGEMEEKTAKGGRSSYAVNFTKEFTKTLVKAYYEESKWLNNNKVPTLEEYLKVALVSSGYQALSAASFAGFGEMATEDSFDWLLSEPRILQAICAIARLMDDIVSYKFEQQREHIPSAVECYMNLYKVSEREACEELNKRVRNAWKDINQAFLTPGNPPRPLLMRLLNLSRVIDTLYTDGDSYTHSSSNLKHLIASLFINPVEL